MSREAMQMALEALESDPVSHAGLVNRKQAITALRQALEEKRKPVFWTVSTGWVYADDTSQERGDETAKNRLDKEDIIRMAREAGAGVTSKFGRTDYIIMTRSNLERFAALIAEHEREAIMKICNRHTEPIAGVIYHAIRARGDR